LTGSDLDRWIMKQTEPATNAQANSLLVVKKFRELHAEPAGIFRAPGRVNLIGEHTDYNEGFVMPAALGFYAYVAAGLRADRLLQVTSIDFGESSTFDLDSLAAKPSSHWSDYVCGVAGVMRSRGVRLKGTNLVVKGEVPIGAGLSSSAAIEVAVAFALLATSNVEIDRREIAQNCQRAEHEYAGTKCGIMD
jgi:galactokinase